MDFYGGQFNSGFFMYTRIAIVNLFIQTGKTVMSKIILNIHQINQLEDNPNAASVSGRSIQYTVEFKVKAVRENINGKGPQQIITEAGLDLTVIGKRKAQPSLNRWRQTFIKDGKESLRNDKRGKSLGGGRLKTYKSMERRLAKTEARIKCLTTENELLKKLEKLEGQAKRTK